MTSKNNHALVEEIMELLTEENRIMIERYKKLRANANKNNKKYVESHREVQRRNAKKTYDKNKDCPLFKEKQRLRKQRYKSQKLQKELDKKKESEEEDLSNIVDIQST